MNGTMVTLVGHVISEVRYATTAGGVPVASFRLAATDRRFDRQRQMWVEGDTSFFTVWSWRWLAENVLGSVGRGDPLLVTGRMRVREWDNGDGNARGVAAEIEATAIGHDLSRGTSAFRRAARGRPELVTRGPSRAVDDGTGPDRPAGLPGDRRSSSSSSTSSTAGGSSVGSSSGGTSSSDTLASGRGTGIADTDGDRDLGAAPADGGTTAGLSDPPAPAPAPTPVLVGAVAALGSGPAGSAPTASEGSA